MPKHTQKVKFEFLTEILFLCVTVKCKVVELKILFNGLAFPFKEITYDTFIW